METSPPLVESTSPDWHRSLAEAVRDPDRLIDLLGLPEEYREPARRAAKLFPLMVPRSYLDRMRPGDLTDPLLLQVLPLGLEEANAPEFVNDPVGDSAARRAPGLLQKYEGRGLLITTGACAVHCRYCFRRHYPYGEEPRRLDDWEPALAEIAGDGSLTEVILSGGDPLMLTDNRLATLVERIAVIPHVRRVRFHTRLPIVLPERVNESFLDLLRSCGKTTVIVVHANHARELTGTCAEALQQLTRAATSVLNQAVLLRGINDSVDALADLSERLIDLGVLPYYLHQLDRVQGAAHFEVAEERGREMIAALRARLPGYAAPRYVREVAGDVSKRPIL